MAQKPPTSLVHLPLARTRHTAPLDYMGGGEQSREDDEDLAGLCHNGADKGERDEPCPVEPSSFPEEVRMKRGLAVKRAAGGHSRQRELNVQSSV